MYGKDLGNVTFSRVIDSRFFIVRVEYACSM